MARQRSHRNRRQKSIRRQRRFSNLEKLESRQMFTAGPPTIESVAFNAAMNDPADLAVGPQPTNWATQRHSLRSIDIEFSEPVVISVDDLALTNLGLNSQNRIIQPVDLTPQQLIVDGDHARLLLDEAQMSDGVYRLTVLPSVVDGAGIPLDGDADGMPGGTFHLIGNSNNRFHQLTTDVNGDGGVSVYDFQPYSYWFGQNISVAPEYMDWNSDGGVTVFEFSILQQNFGKQVEYPAAPIATDDTISTNEDEPIQIAVLANDLGGEGESALHIIHVEADDVGGQVEVVGNGQFILFSPHIGQLADNESRHETLPLYAQ